MIACSFSDPRRGHPNRRQKEDKKKPKKKTKTKKRKNKNVQGDSPAVRTEGKRASFSAQKGPTSPSFLLRRNGCRRQGRTRWHSPLRIFASSEFAHYNSQLASSCSSRPSAVRVNTLQTCGIPLRYARSAYCSALCFLNLLVSLLHYSQSLHSGSHTATL